MAVISRGFHRRHEADLVLPPGQHLTTDFPMLSAGPTPHVSPERWAFTITTETGEERRWTWDEFLALPTEEPTVDIHCVTSWSKLGTTWRGVSLDVLLGDVGTSAEAAMAQCYGGYTTNVPLADLTGGKAWIVHTYDGKPLRPEHGGPARLLVPHLYFWKSAKWISGLQLLDHDAPGFWESLGYHLYGDPWKEQRYRGQ
ncbi:MAG: sulfite oxidase-like oxidoreductase [Actinomycetes bacterium]